MCYRLFVHKETHLFFIKRLDFRPDLPGFAIVARVHSIMHVQQKSRGSHAHNVIVIERAHVSGEGDGSGASRRRGERLLVDEGVLSHFARLRDDVMTLAHIVGHGSLLGGDAWRVRYDI